MPHLPHLSPLHPPLHPPQTYGVKLDVPERTNEVAGQYAAAVEALAAELGLPCLNLWAAFQAVPGWQQALLSDGLHLTQQGNEEVYRLLRALIDARYPHLRCARCRGAAAAAVLLPVLPPCCCCAAAAGLLLLLLLHCWSQPAHCTPPTHASLPTLPCPITAPA